MEESLLIVSIKGFKHCGEGRGGERRVGDEFYSLPQIEIGRTAPLAKYLQKNLKPKL